MIKCIIDEILEEWNKFYKNVINNAILKKEKQVVTNKCTRTRRKSAVEPCKFNIERQRRFKKSFENKKEAEKAIFIEENNVDVKLGIKTEECGNKDIASPINDAKNDNLAANINISEKKEEYANNVIDVFTSLISAANVNSHSNNINTVPENLQQNSNKNFESVVPIITSKDKLQNVLNKKPLSKKSSKTKKKPVVVMKNFKKKPKQNNVITDIDEKLRIIKLGKKASINEVTEENKNNFTSDQPLKAGSTVPIDNQKMSLLCDNQSFKEPTLPQLNDKAECNNDLENHSIKQESECVQVKNEDFTKNNDQEAKLKKKNEILKSIFRKEKLKVDMKRNSVFINENNTNCIKNNNFKELSKFSGCNNVDIGKLENNLVDKKFALLPRRLDNTSILLATPEKIKFKFDNKKIQADLLSSDVKSPKAMKNKVYDVKSSKFLIEPNIMRNDLYKKVIDSQRKGLSQNEYKSSTIIPHIKSDDEDSLIFIEPLFCKDPEINEKVCKQSHKQLEEYFNLCEDINVVEIFPNIKDITNDSPNKWN